MKPTTLLDSDRSFVIFSYSINHGLLLLRSKKAGKISTRLDVLFQDVRAMEIRSWFDGLKIEEVGAEYLGKQGSAPVALMETGNRVYRLIGDGWEGFILGGIVSFNEDEEDFFAPSKLLKESA